MPVRKLRCLDKCVFTRVVCLLLFLFIYFTLTRHLLLFLFIYFAPLRSPSLPFAPSKTFLSISFLSCLIVFLLSAGFETEHQKHHCRLLLSSLSS